MAEAEPSDGGRTDESCLVHGRMDDVPSRATSLGHEEVATQCHDLLEMSMHVLVDGVDDRVGRAYSGMVDRLYVVDREGMVAFKSGRGPFWFNPGEMEQALIMTLLDEMPPVKKAQAGDPLMDKKAVR